MKNINDDIKNNKLKPFYLLYGDERYLINQFKDKFINLFAENKELNQFYYNKENFSEEKVAKDIQRAPFLSDKKLIIFEDINIDNDDILDLLERCKNVNLVLYILKEDLYDDDRYKKIIKFFEDNGYVASLTAQTEEDIKKHVKSHVINNNKSISTSDIAYFVDRVGCDLYNVNNELNKIISYIGSRDEITRDDIDKVTHETITDTTFTLIDYINKGDMNKAYLTYAKLKEDDVEPMDIYGALKYNYNMILKVKSLQERELSSKNIMSLAKIRNKYQYEIISRISKNNSTSFYIKKIQNLYRCNKMFMTGDIDDKVWVEVMISE